MTIFKLVLTKNIEKSVTFEFSDTFENVYEIEYRIKGKKSELLWYINIDNQLYVNKLSNSYEAIKIFKTVLASIEEFINIRSEIKEITFEGVAKEREKEYLTQRSKFYAWYLKRHPLENWKLENHINKFKLIKI